MASNSKSRSMSYPYFIISDQRPENNINHVNSGNSRRSQSLSDDLSSVEIQNSSDIASSMEILSTSGLLQYCKKFILQKYIYFLSVLGLKPFVIFEDSPILKNVFLWGYVVFIFSFTIFSYIFQNAMGFRRDILCDNSSVNKRLFAPLYGAYLEEKDEKDYTKIVAIVFPNLLHFCTYCYNFYLMRILEYEQMQILVEKAFLQTFHSATTFITQPKLMKIFKCFLGGYISWLLLSLTLQITQVFIAQPKFHWIDVSNGWNTVFLVLLVILMTWQDIIHITVIWSYCIQCRLLMICLRSLTERIRGRMVIQEAIKEIAESFKMLKSLNDDMSAGVSILILYSGSLLISGIIWLIAPNSPCKWSIVTWFLVILWTISFIFPIIQAVRLTAACKSISRIGHHVRARPFGYQDVPQEDLDSFLLYTSTLNMKTKLFRIPVQAGFVYGIVAIGGLLIVVVAQLNCIYW